MQKSLKKNFVLSVFRTLVMMVVPLVIFPYASRILGKEGVGRVQYIQSIATYFQLFATSGITYYGIREGVKFREDREKMGQFVSEMLLINFLTTAVAMLAYTILFFVPSLSGYHTLIAMFGIYVISNGINLDWFFNVREDYLYITVKTFFLYLLAVILMFVLLHDAQDFLIYALVIILPYAGTLLTNLRQIRKTVPLTFKKKYHLKKHICPIMMVFSITVSSSIYLLLDSTMLGAMCGDGEVGLYTSASKLSRLVVQVITAVCAVFLPRLSYYVGRSESEKFKQLAERCAKLIIILTIPCAIGIFSLAPEAILIFSGEEFLAAVPALRILAWNLFFSAADSFIGWQILVPNNKERFLLLATVLGAGMDFGLNFLLIPHLGVEGAALATLFAECTVFIVCVVASRHLLLIRNLMVQILKCIVASLPILVVALTVGLFFHSVVLKSTVTVLVAGIIYFILLLIMNDEIVCYGRDWIVRTFSVHKKNLERGK